MTDRPPAPGTAKVTAAVRTDFRTHGKTSERLGSRWVARAFRTGFWHTAGHGQVHAHNPSTDWGGSRQEDEQGLLVSQLGYVGVGWE